MALMDKMMGVETDEQAYWLAQGRKLIALFEGVRSRRPETPEELNDWLATDEGKAAISAHLTPDGKIIPD